MGEYASYNGSRVKIGTCESMYYLRADQAHLVRHEHGNVDPIGDREEIRFRFPFPDEDAVEPGCFEDYSRGVKIPGAWNLPEDFEHTGSVQFSAPPGYLLSIPCPEGPNVPEGIRVGKNGWSGGYVVRQQRYIEGEWWTVVACGSCGHAWRLPRELAADVAASFLDESERTEYRPQYDHEAGEYVGGCEHVPAHQPEHRAFLQAMAARIIAGYLPALEATA